MVIKAQGEQNARPPSPRFSAPRAGLTLNDIPSSLLSADPSQCIVRLSAQERAALWDDPGIVCHLSCPEACRQPQGL